MPEINFSPVVEWVIIIGAISGALTAVILLGIKIASGVTWVGKKHQYAVLAPATHDIEKLQAKQEEILTQLVSFNSGSLREVVNDIQKELRLITEQLEEHRKWSYENHAVIEHKLKKYGLAGPISDVDTQ